MGLQPEELKLLLNMNYSRLHLGFLSNMLRAGILTLVELHPTPPNLAGKTLNTTFNNLWCYTQEGKDIAGLKLLPGNQCHDRSVRPWRRVVQVLGKSHEFTRGKQFNICTSPGLTAAMLPKWDAGRNCWTTLWKTCSTTEIIWQFGCKHKHPRWLVVNLVFKYDTCHKAKYKRTERP